MLARRSGFRERPPRVLAALARHDELRRLTAVALAGTCVGLLFARRSPDAYDAGIMLEVGRNLLTHGSVRVHSDYFGINTPYASYGIGMTFLLGVLYEIGHVLGFDATALAMAANSLIFGLLGATIAWLARLRGAGWRPALATSGLTCLATPLLVLTATGFSELGVALGLALGLAGLSLTKADDRRGPPLVATGAMLALLFRTDSAPLVVLPLVVGLLVLTRQRRALLSFAVAAAPGFGIWLAYNAVRFGAPWRLGYQGERFDHPIVRGLLDLTFSPSRGLLDYTPIILLAVFGLRASWRRDRVILAVGIAALLLRFALYSHYWGWYGSGGWGPRLVVPALPVVSIPLLDLLEHRPWQRWAVAVGGGLIAISVSIQLVGAGVLPQHARDFPALSAVYERGGSTGPDALRYLASPTGQRQADAVLMRPGLEPFTGQARAFVRRDAMADSIIGTAGDTSKRLALLLAILLALAHALTGTSRREISPRASDQPFGCRRLH